MKPQFSELMGTAMRDADEAAELFLEAQAGEVGTDGDPSTNQVRDRSDKKESD